MLLTGGGTTHGPTTEKTIFGKCGDKTDQTKLETLLEVAKRKEMRDKIRDLKKVHVEWLQGKVNGRPVARNDFIDVNTAISDYFSTEGYRYLQGWEGMKGLIAGIDTDPCAIDGRLDLPQNKGRTPYKDDPGCQYLESLLRPSHPLHTKLFPTEQQAPVTIPVPHRNLSIKTTGWEISGPRPLPRLSPEHSKYLDSSARKPAALQNS